MWSRTVISLLIAVAAGSAAAAPLPLTLAEGEALLARNRDVLAAQRNVDGARAGVTIAGQAPNPTLSYSATSINPQTGIGAGGLKDKRMDQTLALSQLVERGDKRELRSGGAEALLRASTADLADTRRQQRLVLHQAYFDLKAAQDKVRLLGETARLYQHSLDAAELRLKVGDLAAVEASRLRVEASRARNDERAAQGDLARARQALAYLIGEAARAEELVAADDWPAVADAVGLAADVERRPDVRAARARIDAALRARDVARSLATRDVTVGAQVERYPPDTGGVTYGVTLSVPLFARYGYEGELAKAESDYTATLEAAETAALRARLDAARALSDLSATAERRRRTEAEALPEARRVAEAAEFAYRKGAMNVTDLLDARRTLRALEIETVAALADYAKARAAWLAATEWEAASP